MAALYAMVPEVDAVVPLNAAGAGDAAGRVATATRPGWRQERFDLRGAAAEFVHVGVDGVAGGDSRSAGATPPTAAARCSTRRVRRPRGLLHQADYYLALTGALGLPAVAAPGADYACRRRPRAAAAALLAGIPARRRSW